MFGSEKGCVLLVNAYYSSCVLHVLNYTFTQLMFGDATQRAPASVLSTGLMQLSKY